MATYPELKGKCAVIAGASGNLGAAVARRLYAEGVKLVLMGHSEDGLKRTIHEGSILADSAMLGAVDLLAKSDVEQFIERVAVGYGQIDILVNTAGGYRPGKPVYEMDETDWDSLLDLNAKTAFILCSAIARQMVAKGNKGRIVNVAGKAGLSAFGTGSAYSAGKAALLRLTESLSAELLPKGITVNAVLPSTIDTPQNRADNPNTDYTKWVTVDSIADVIAFLVSESARDISGAHIPVYGRA
jgi:NAD(P)-dependent dehydrogenase (short-subunit alcohol dehydrogenase family)